MACATNVSISNCQLALVSNKRRNLCSIMELALRVFVVMRMQNSDKTAIDARDFNIDAKLGGLQKLSLL